MSDFFNKVKEGINKTTNFVSVKSSTLVESNKLRNEIASLSKEKRSLFSKIGEEMYKMKKEKGTIEATNVEDIIQKIFDIDAKKLELEQKLKELAEKEEEALKNVKPQGPINRTCSCGAKLTKDAKFCVKCGAKVPESIVVDVKASEKAVEVVGEHEAEEADIVIEAKLEKE